MRPKEIVYLSFGSTANHVATHFWNTQQTYFDYSPHAPPPIVEHDVSFKAGLGTDGLDTYTPRTLLFDVREEFGALARINALYEESSEDAFDGETLETVPRVQPSAMADALTAPATATKHEGPPRYWSDFAQTPYHPKSLLHVAAPSLYGHSFLSSMGTDSLNPTFDTFAQGVRVAKAMEDEQQVMEDTLRWWAEDSDLLQGFQMTTSSSDAFAGFSHTYLQYVADEYPKSERHVALLGRAYEAKYQPYVTMNNILSLVHFYEQASMLVPIRMSGPTTDFLRPDWNSMYENSAVLAALFESATLPLRLTHRSHSMVDMRAQLVWRGDSRLVQLGGCIPTPLLADVRASTSVDHLIDAMFAARGLKMEALATPPSSSTDKLGPVWWDATRSFGRLYMPSNEDATAMAVPYAETMVARDADAMAEKPTLDAMQAWQKDLKEPLISSHFVPLAFPTTPPYPSFWYGLTRDGRPWPRPHEREKLGVVESVPCMASLRSSPDSLDMILEARQCIVQILQGHEPLATYGLTDFMDRDGLLEVREALESMSNAYGGVPDDQAEPGTDEEWEDDDEWDL